MYCEYCIGPDQWSMNIQNDLNFWVVQVQVLLVVEEVYSWNRLAFLRVLQLNCYHHIGYTFQQPGVVAAGNTHLCLYV